MPKADGQTLPRTITGDDSSRHPIRATPLHAARGFLIGCAELVPGVSGGTVALITGIYEQLMDGAYHVITAARKLVTGPDRLASAYAELRSVKWWLILPVLLGMLLAVAGAAGAMEGFVSSRPEQARGLFFGMVIASLIVPIRMLPAAGRRVTDPLIALAAAVVAFLLTSFVGTQQQTEPSLLLVGVAAAIAICALVIPGVSGSFFLLAVGLYGPTLGAVSNRLLPYLLVFALGALIGLCSFVQVMRWLLKRHRRITLLVMVGLMAGSLRALWPWQQGSSLMVPGGDVLLPALLALAGAVAVALMVWLEARAKPAS